MAANPIDVEVIQEPDPLHEGLQPDHDFPLDSEPQRSFRETFVRHRGKFLILTILVIVLVLFIVGSTATGIALVAQGGSEDNDNDNDGDNDDNDDDDGNESVFSLPDEDIPFDTDDFDDVYDDPYPLDRTKKLQKDLYETKEYQLRLDVNAFTDREKGVADFLEILRAVTGLPFDPESAMESVRVEYQIDGSKCGDRKYDEIRIRNYISGWNQGNSTIDIKYSKKTLSKKDAAAIDILPSSGIYPTSIQKIEQDVHHCYNKYTRKTMALPVPYDPKISKCGDITALFPNAWDEKNPTKSAPTKSTTYWWLYQHQGYMLNGAQYLSSFTVIYHDLQGAVKGNEQPSHSSEWSLRIWSTEDGMGPWDRNVLIDVERIYQTLLAEIGSFQDDC